MSIYRIWQITEFELTRLFATKRGLFALAAFSMVWLMILKYPVNQAVSILSDPEFSGFAQGIAGTIGFRTLLSWPEAEFAVYWILSIYCFPIFSLLVSADQTVGDRERGTLRFMALRCTRDELLLGRFFGQLLIIAILILATALATLLLMVHREPTLAATGIIISIQLSIQLMIISMPFISLMAFLNVITRSAKLSIISAVLIFTFGAAIIAYIERYLPFFEILYYLFPGEQISGIADQSQFNLINWLIPISQSAGWLVLAIVLLRRRAI